MSATACAIADSAYCLPRPTRAGGAVSTPASGYAFAIARKAGMAHSGVPAKTTFLMHASAFFLRAVFCALAVE